MGSLGWCFWEGSLRACFRESVWRGANRQVVREELTGNRPSNGHALDHLRAQWPAAAATTAATIINNASGSSQQQRHPTSTSTSHPFWEAKCIFVCKLFLKKIRDKLHCRAGKVEQFSELRVIGKIIAGLVIVSPTSASTSLSMLSMPGGAIPMV